MPDEFINLPYHSYNDGHGKAAHSGYHIIDLVCWFMQAGELEGKKIDTANVHVHSTRPGDLLAHLNLDEYKKLFPGYGERCPYSEADIASATERFGEVDAIVSVAFESKGRTITMESINLLHNGFSGRGSMVPNYENLYKGNGRVRHETHVIHQGPFQAIHFSALRTGGKNGQDQVEVKVFRNTAFNPSWEIYQNLYFSESVPGGTKGSDTNTGALMQEVARMRSIKEYIEFLYGKIERDQVVSDLLSHNRTSKIISSVYRSMSEQYNGGSRVVAVDFRLESEALKAVDGHRNGSDAQVYTNGHKEDYP